MSYREARWPKLVIGMIALGVLVVFFSRPFWHPLKERYFNYVAESCSETHGLETIAWHDVPAFDAQVLEFRATSPQEIAVRDCIGRWASVIMNNRVSADGAQPTIEFVLTDNHLDISSPPRQVYYAYIRPAD